MGYAGDKNKLSLYTAVNSTMLTMCIIMFTFIAASTLGRTILTENYFFTLQLVLAIPLIFLTISSNIHAVHMGRQWHKISFVSLTLAYGFLMNVIGLLLSFFTPAKIFLVFFGVYILTIFAKSTIKLSYEKNPDARRERIFKDIFYILVSVFGGILPALQVY